MHLIFPEEACLSYFEDLFIADRSGVVVVDLTHIERDKNHDISTTDVAF